MKKLIALLIVSLVYSPFALASGGHGHRERGYRHSHHPHHRIRYAAPVYYVPVERHYYREEVRYYPQRVDRYYREPDRYYDDRRTTSGLVGGALGGALGYEAGRGDPIAAGIGAAAGSLFGNGMR